MSLDVDGSFVGEKIAKIRWVTATSGVTGFADGPADHFITGSWDNDNTGMQKSTFYFCFILCRILIIIDR